MPDRQFLLGMLLIAVGVGGLIAYTVNAIDRRSCLEAWADFDPQYTWTDGCKIRVHGNLVSTDAIAR